MLKINEVIVVEGMHDKKKLQQSINATIITTNGFDIYGNKAKISLLKRLAKERGLIVLTDSDSAGFRIRSYIKSCIGSDNIKHAYIPDILGKERRKAKPSKEGTLGVEGMHPDVLKNALISAGCKVDNVSDQRRIITKTDLFDFGLTGAENSANLRAELSRKLNLPIKISTNSLIEILNVLYTHEQFTQAVSGLTERSPAE